MSLVTPIDLVDTDKLRILQRLDQHRRWSSLADKRYCLVCSTIITGRDIKVVGGTRGTGPLRLICWTRGCHSIPMDWVLPTDEVLSNMSISKNKHEVPAAKSSKHYAENLAARLRKLATRFRRAA